MLIKLKAGDVAPETGFYNVITKSGKTLYQIFINKGERLPPITEKNCFYVLY